MFRLILFVLLLTINSSLQAQLTVNPLFQDHAVLQRDIAVPIKGKASPGTTVHIDLGNDNLVTTTGRDGRWRVLLPQMKAGGPYQITITTDTERIVLEDIYFGDVWLCSGQSNMEWPLRQCDNAEAEIAAAGDLAIRHIGIPHSGGTELYDEIGGGEWQVDNPTTAGGFTGVGYFFARHIRQHIDVPIGLLHSSWGGSRIEPWMRAEILGYEDAGAAMQLIEDKQRAQSEARMAKLRPIVGDLTTEDAGMEFGKPIWADPTVDISDWSVMTVPSLWESGPLPEFDGVVWMAMEVEVSSDPTGQSAMLSLGKIDDSDITFVNGIKVGGLENAYAQIRSYNIPDGVLVKGKNRIVVRVQDDGGGGGIYGESSDMSLTVGAQKIELAGMWKYKAAAMFKTGSQNINQQPTLLYNHMIHPLLDFPIKGALWYQGESNAGTDDALNYEDQLATMIKDWRKLWGVGDFPFLSVQLANFRAPDDQPTDGGWPRVREAIANVSNRVPHTGDAVIIDIGEADDIHPTNKQDVGKRLGLLARKIAYGQDDHIWNSPRYKSKRVEGDKIVLQFDHVGEGLFTKNKFGYIHGFAIAGDDQHFEWAQASITGDNEIAVHALEVRQPTQVRYGWGINPDVIDVYNSAHLPLSPFRTDGWGYPMIKYLALGDSYTAGTSVEQTQSFPYQLALALSGDVNTVEVDVIARNGWTTTDLLDSIQAKDPSSDYDIVTLLIGVNNQYQAKPYDLYKKELPTLIEKAIQYAGGDPDKVVLVSIPDYAYTPYGQTRPNLTAISKELDKYNAYADEMSRKYGTHFVHITDITRKGLEDPSLVAKDDLHPSGAAYSKMVPRIRKVLGR